MIRQFFLLVFICYNGIVFGQANGKEYAYKEVHLLFNEQGDTVYHDTSSYTLLFDNKGHLIENYDAYLNGGEPYYEAYNYRDPDNSYILTRYMGTVYLHETCKDCQEGLGCIILYNDTIESYRIRCNDAGEVVFRKCLKGCTYTDSLVMEHGAHYWHRQWSSVKTEISFMRIDHLGNNIKYLENYQEPSDTLKAYEVNYDYKNFTSRESQRIYIDNVEWYDSETIQYYQANWIPTRKETWKIDMDGIRHLSSVTSYIEQPLPAHHFIGNNCNLYLNNVCRNFTIVKGQKNLINIYYPEYDQYPFYVEAKHAEIIQDGSFFYAIPKDGEKCTIRVGYIAKKGLKNKKVRLSQREFLIVEE